MCEYVVH